MYSVRSSAPAPRRQAKSLAALATENLEYIRSTIEAARTFTAVPGKGCIAMGVVGLAAAALESVPALASHWLAIWLTAAVVACASALVAMEIKAQAQGSSLRRAIALRFFLTLVPAFTAGAVLTAALHDTVGRGAIAAIWLLLYGAGMASCGVFSIPAVLAAGFAFMALGSVMFAAPPASAAAMLALGFGGIHLALGAFIVRNHGG
ncbi:MAG TPA: hypothetical protein VF329_11160 [Gammaproteobacteria bacterium]